MAEAQVTKERGGLSLRTLVIAAVASAVAAVLVNKLWQGGTVIAAAMTPVVVAIVKELLERPMQSEVVRRTASRVTESTSRRVLTGAAARTEEVRRRSPTTSTPPPSANGNRHDGELTPGDIVLSHPRRTYGGRAAGRFRRVRLKLAVVTGLLAFVIAAAALTVPELVFGGAVGSGDRTTFFGGDGKARSEPRGERDGSDSDSERSQPELNPQAPAGEGDEGSQPAPEQEAPSEPAPAGPQEPAPQQAPPSGGAPAPQTPAPATP